ncbi:zinc metallo ase nas-4-like [Paramuricea clavata]|uniref:Zinc metallo ase nas-4-like n=1 Tax=Paramuricea clavata TaxID=317549 RepID=A0A7D9J9W4_PARCT|nr:zinc metallo ase nas-4-like [Paramuricea clavata]
MEYNFEIVESYDYGQSSPYDPGSVMHYGPYAFAKDKTKTTIDSLFGATIGQSLQLSDADVELAKSLYDCGTGSCFDLNTGCKHWANNGGCNEYRQWMLEHCQKSCCSAEDTHQSCSYWASIGECEKNPGWMLENCKRSCHICECSNTGY